jgi:hypothetical protein
MRKSRGTRRSTVTFYTGEAIVHEPEFASDGLMNSFSMQNIGRKGHPVP